MPPFYQKIFALLLSYKYFIFFPLVLFEGPITTIIAGLLCSLGYMDFILTYILAAVADLTSDAGYYALGRWGRQRIVEKYGRYFGVTASRMEKLENQFKNYGVKMLAFGKVADPLSSTIQTIAGLTKMNFNKYFSWNIAITFPKSLILLAIGFYFGEAINKANFYRQLIGIFASIMGIIFIAVYFIYRNSVEKKLK